MLTSFSHTASFKVLILNVQDFCYFKLPLMHTYITKDITATNPSPSLHKNHYCIMKKRDPFPMNEMDHKFGKIVIFSKQYKILEIRKCYSMALVFTFDIPEIVSPGT